MEISNNKKGLKGLDDMMSIQPVLLSWILGETQVYSGHICRVLAAS